MSLAVIKHYADRAVQTDLAITSPGPGFTIDVSDTSTCFLHALKTVSSLETELPMDSPAKSSAYMRSEHLPLEDTVEFLASRKDRKLVSLASGLGYPSTCTTKTERVLSLPVHTSSSDAAHLAVLEKQKRIVSMPERSKLSNLISVSENARANTHLGTGNMTRSHPSDVPQTPSPPSSPDSVMIIGNEEQVSESFLQGRRRSFITEDGWVTWASSPPRPIPALHGPLSLPYARCPSGAEGTVVEGDDLSHKIWGLGADDTPAHTRYQRALPQTAPQSVPANRSLGITAHIIGDQHQVSSHQRRRDTVIDLSQPSTFDHIQDTARQPLKNPAHTATHGSISKGSTNLPDLTASTMAKLTILPHVRQPEYQDDTKTCITEAAAGDQLGLALQWESLFNSDPKAKAWMNGPNSPTTGQSSSIRLNTSAPPFVPQSYVSSSLVDRAILLDKPQVAQTQSTQKLGSYSLDAAPAAPTTRIPPKDNAPSPPSTVSPLWTPIFTQTADMLQAYPRSFGPKAGRQMPDVYSPELDRGGYQSDQLASMHTISQLQSYDLQSLGRDRDLNKKKYSSPAFLGDSYSHQEPHLRGGRPPIDIHQDRSLVLFDASNYDHGLGNPTTTTAVDRRRSLTQQHPRSIPLARLIQRRLSSVVEEESFTGAYGGLKVPSAPSPSNSSLYPLPSGAPIRLLPLSSSETVRPSYSSSSVFTPRSRPRMMGNACADEYEAQPVLKSAAVPERQSMIGISSDSGGANGRKLEHSNAREKQARAMVVKLPGPRVDSAARGTSNRSGGGGRAATATATTQKDHAQQKHNSREDASNVEEKENASTSANVENSSSGRTPKKYHNKYKKRVEQVSTASSKADRPT